MLLAELTDFVTRHRACGRMTGDASEPEADGYMLTVTCSCRVVFMRWVTPDEVEARSRPVDPLTTRN